MRWTVVVVVGLGLGIGCGPGDQCAVDDECGAEQICEISDGARQCLDTCHADKPCPSGFACVLQPGEENAVCLGIIGDLEDRRECTLDTQCASGACVGEEDGVQACTSTCAGDEDCGGDERCYVLAQRKICAPPLEDRPTGDGCDSPRECASARCVVLPHVDPDEGRCVDGCETDDTCGEGEGCATLVLGGDVCVDLGDDGEVCANSDTCEGGICIIDTFQEGDEICTSSCGELEDCPEGFACVPDQDEFLVCMPVLEQGAAGDVCDSARDCASGHCGDFTSGGFGPQCADPCDAQDQCADEDRVCYETDFGPNLCGPIPEAP
jgi:hypothetical protein